MTYIIAGVSHKGGTGRSVALANIGYQLTVRGANVLIVDLDLASPTLGSVLDVKGAEVGVMRREQTNDQALNINEMIINRGQYDNRALIDLRELSTSLRPSLQGHSFVYDFLPAGVGYGDVFLNNDMVFKGIGELIGQLRDLQEWHYVLLDIRSGLSAVLEAIGDRKNAIIDLILIHFRWTQQHLAGLQQMLEDERLSGNTRAATRLVRTAMANIDGLSGPLREFINEEDEILRGKFNRMCSNSACLSQDHLIGDVPFDERLRWRETVLLEETKEQTGDAFSGYRALASRIQNLNNEGT